MRRSLVAVVLATAFALSACASDVSAQQRIEGTVVSTKMTACDMKPGSCEGTMVVDTKAAPGQVTIKVQKGTVIRHGDGHLFLPGTKGRTVAITYVESKGENVAQSIEVKTQKP